MATPDSGGDSTDQLLWMIRAGMVDAEIAVRLGISTAEVKQRVERLSKRLNVDGREGLRASSLTVAKVTRDRPRPLRIGRRLGPYVAVGAVCAVLGAVIALGFDSGGAPAGSATPGATVDNAQLLVPSPTPETVTIDGREWVAAGRFSAPFAGFQPLTATSQREEITVVTLQRDSLVRPTDGWDITPANGAGFAGSVGGVAVTLAFLPWGSSGLVVAEDEIVAYSRDGSPPQIIVAAIERLSGRNHSVLVKLDGGILIDPRPSRDDVPIDYNTGEALDVSRATLLGNLGPAGRGTGTNWCIDGPNCIATLTPPPTSLAILAPRAGNVTCPDTSFELAAPWGPVSEALTLNVGDYRIHISRIAMGVGTVPSGSLHCTVEGAVALGQPIIDAGPRYLVAATNSSGNPVSVVFDRNGNVWVGDIAPKLGCPCRSGI